MMEEEDHDQEAAQKQHICKFCNKRFACGRSLGGHMRSHMNNYESPEDMEKKKSSSSMVDFESLNSHTTIAGYGLRENPKKTWRISGSTSVDDHGGKLCKQCGKGFQSWKALFGHMRCHSEKDKVFDTEELDEHEVEDEDSWLVMDSQSDNNEEPEEAPKRRSSRRLRYKNATNSTTTCSLSNFPNAASSVSDHDQIEQDQQEQVAMSLMMLSRDVGSGGLNGLVESSDNNNSVLLEARTTSLSTKANKNLFNNGDHENVKKSSTGKQKLRLRSRVSEPEAAVGFQKKGSKLGGYNESGSLRIGVKKVESEASVGKSFGDVDQLKKSRKLDNKGDFEVFDVELERNSYNKQRRDVVKSSRAELGKSLTKERSDLKYGNKYNNSSNYKRAKTDSYDRESEVVSYKKVWDSEIRSKSSKKSKYKCMTCNKMFHSYQALGGHRASHKKIKGCFASKIHETSENSIETEVSHDPTADSKLMKDTTMESEVTGSTAETSYGVVKKNKHECPICLKVFSSGQALGGHKRSHGLGGASDQLARSITNQTAQTIVAQKQVPEIRDSFDLNLPAPGEEDDNESNGDVGYEPWWVGSNLKHKSLVGLISN